MIHLDTYIDLLKRCIATPSLSREEHHTARLLSDFLASQGKSPELIQNNVWVKSQHFDTQPELPVILLVSHHDTVKPSSSWTYPPFEATEVEDGKIIGLGSNDAGASLVSLTATFLHLDSQKNNAFRFILALVAEEEITGKNGLSALLPHLGKIDFALVGEPTTMRAAIAEKGLLVLDATTHGKSGHAARNEGTNAIGLAVEDISWINQFAFEKKSDVLGKVNLNVTQIQAGSQHNVIPDRCTYVIDVRTNEYYTHQDILDILSPHLRATLLPRSTHLQSSSTPAHHPILHTLHELGIETFGSPTLSDWCVLRNVPAIKIGPGDSSRSHQADEYIYRKEIEKGIDTYINIITHLAKPYENLG